MSPKDIGTNKDVEAELTKNDFMKYVSLLQGSSGALTELDGAKPGFYSLGKDVLLGAEFEAVVSISRPRAILFANNEMAAESFDPKSAEWSKIKNTRKGGNTGLEFLLWIPAHKCFATYYFKNTAKPEGAKAVACRESGSLAKFSSRMIEGKENSWYVPVVRSAGAVTDKHLPSDEAQAEAVAQFESYKQEEPATPEGNER